MSHDRGFTMYEINIEGLAGLAVEHFKFLKAVFFYYDVCNAHWKSYKIFSPACIEHIVYHHLGQNLSHNWRVSLTGCRGKRCKHKTLSYCLIAGS